MAHETSFFCGLNTLLITLVYVYLENLYRNFYIILYQKNYKRIINVCLQKYLWDLSVSFQDIGIALVYGL